MKNILSIKNILFILLIASFTNCKSVKKAVAESKPNSEKINWPDTYKPEEAGFFVHNEIEIQAPPEIVWQYLINAEAWPQWYEGMTAVKVKTNDTGILEKGSEFSFKTMGQNFETVTIKEFEPPYRLSWEAVKNDIQGYHAWLILPTENGCTVITSEAQQGFKAFLQKAFLPNKLEKLHDIWLQEFKKLAENETIKQNN